MTDFDQLEGTVVGGRYRVSRKLGEGGMGAVYAAVQQPLGREIALKVIRGEIAKDPSVAERFTREATTLSQLSHPNVVTIFDFGVDGSLLFLAMELLKGETLRQRVRRLGSIPPLSTLPIVRDIASGLSVAHEAAVVHRDLKPDNVMLVGATGRGELAKILDFGVAKIVDGTKAGQTLTQTGMLVGTPGYMAPELALHGVTNEPRSDLYALGVMWFEMLVGRALFEAQTPVMLVMKHATEKPPRPSELVPSVGISGEVEELVLQLLEKDPERRPASAQALIAHIDAIQSVAGGNALPRSMIPSSASFAQPNGGGPPATVTTMGGLASFRSVPSNPPVSSPSVAAPAPAPVVTTSSASRAPASNDDDATEPPKSRAAMFAAGGGLLGLIVVVVGGWLIIGSTKNAAEHKPDDPPAPAVVDVKPAVDPKPVVDAKPAVDAKPVVDAKPIETKPVVDAKPIETKPVVDVKPVEVKKKVDVKKPLDAKTFEKKVETKTVDPKKKDDKKKVPELDP